MDWSSFLWGIGTLLFVNIVYGLWVAPKVIGNFKRTQRAEKEVLSGLGEKLNLMKFEHIESIKLWKERAEEMRLELDKHTATRLELDKLTASVKLRTNCPACGHEFPLYVFEEEKVNG